MWLQGLPVINGKRPGQLPGPLRVLPAHTGDSVQRVMQEVGIDLGAQCPYFRFAAQAFLIV